MASRRKCITAIVFVLEIILFSALTFAIAYVSSLNAIHSASQQLADSMADTVAERVESLVDSTELSTKDLALATGGSSMLPSDNRSPDWAVEWMYNLRTRRMINSLGVSSVAVEFDDGSLVAVSVFPSKPPLQAETVLDAHNASVQGYRTVQFALRDFATLTEIPNAVELIPLFKGKRDYRKDLFVPEYYTLASKLGRRDHWCAWIAPIFNPDSLTFQHCVACAMFNSTDAFLGMAVTARDVSATGVFLQQAATTPNTNIFIVDTELHLVASSSSTPTNTYFTAYPSSGDLPSGCVSATDWSNTTFNATEVLRSTVGCRASARTFPYAPLQQLAESDPDFLTTVVRRSDYRALTDGVNYFLVSFRLTDVTFLLYSMNLVLFLPEGDVTGDVKQGLLMSVLVCVALSVTGSVLSSTLILTLRGNGTRRRRTRHQSVEEATGEADCPSLAEWFAIYNNAVVASRRQAVNHRRRSARSSLNSQGCDGDAASSAANSGATLIRSRTLSSEGSDRTVSLNTGSEDLSSGSTETAVALAVQLTEAASQSLLDSIRFGACVNDHGGQSCRRLGTVDTVLWRASAPPHDDAVERAVLCALALVRAGIATRGGVCLGDISTSDPGLFGRCPLADEAAALLLVERHEEAVLVHSRAAAAMRLRALFQGVDEENGPVRITGVHPVAWGAAEVERKVHFSFGPKPLRALLRRAAAHGELNQDSQQP